MSSASVNSALEVWRPAPTGEPYLRRPAFDSGAGSVAVLGGRIAAFEALPEADLRVDASGCAVIPGFVDPHTHLPFAGWREREYAMKIAGESYEAIARTGGGIRASARALAGASDEGVLAQAEALAEEMLAHGTTAFEMKSGYGLSVDGELRALELASRLAPRCAQTSRVTALLAHAVPDGYNASTWMEEVARMLPSVRATALDIYVESIAFSNDDLRVMGALADEYGYDLRAHVEQFNDNGSTLVAVEIGARSVDHLACVTPDGVARLAHAETAAVLLPGAEWLGDEHLAPGRELADRGAICVLGTDLNPGTSPVASMPAIIGLAVRRYRWSIAEALAAATLNGAWVLRLHEELGSLEVGKRADLVLLDGPLERVPYRFAHNPVELVMIDGEVAHIRRGSEWRVDRG